jgi:hypothetical protein
MRYFRVVDDLNVRGRWHVGSPESADGNAVDERVLLEGQQLVVTEPLSFAVRRRGHPLDFTFADSDVPLLSARAADVFRDLAGVDAQLVPCRVEGYTEPHYVLNVLALLPCLDRLRSKMTLWRREDGRADRVGSPRMITELHISADQVAKRHVFRVAEWRIALVVSDDVRRALLAHEVSGPLFEEV